MSEIMKKIKDLIGAGKEKEAEQLLAELETPEPPEIPDDSNKITVKLDGMPEGLEDIEELKRKNAALEARNIKIDRQAILNSLQLQNIDIGPLKDYSLEKLKGVEEFLSKSKNISVLSLDPKPPEKKKMPVWNSEKRVFE